VEYGFRVLAAATTTSSECFPAAARGLHLCVRRFKGVFGGLLESCSSLMEVGHLLCNGGVSADATVIIPRAQMHRSDPAAPTNVPGPRPKVACPPHPNECLVVDQFNARQIDPLPRRGKT